MSKPIFIIVEGPDNVGKGTQIKLLHTSKIFNDRVFHTMHYSALPFKTSKENIDYSTALYDNMFQLMLDYKLNLQPDYTQNFIFDRSHLGELVYAPLYRKYSGDYVLDIEKEYVKELKDNLIMLVFHNDSDIIFDRDDGLSFYKNKYDVKTENDAFVKAFDQSNIYHKKLIYVGKRTPEDINKEIIKFIENAVL